MIHYIRNNYIKIFLFAVTVVTATLILDVTKTGLEADGTKAGTAKPKDEGYIITEETQEQLDELHDKYDFETEFPTMEEMEDIDIPNGVTDPDRYYPDVVNPTCAELVKLDNALLKQYRYVMDVYYDMMTGNEWGNVDFNKMYLGHEQIDITMARKIEGMEAERGYLLTALHEKGIDCTQ